MSAKSLLLEPCAGQSADGDVVRRCRVSRLDNGAVQQTDELWFRFPAGVPPLDEHDCDSYLLALLMDAMLEERRVVVRGSVSRTLLSNLTEFQAAWQKWLPDVFAPVELVVDAIRDDESPAAGAVCAFSGGVDATFTVWRHTQKLAGYRTQDIRTCVMVHGFDIPLHDRASFDGALLLAKSTLADVGLDVVPLRTNFREISRVPWIHSFAAALVAALNHLRPLAGTCLIGSSEPYDSLVLTCGSNPLTDPLLGSDSFRVLHDGASHSRTEKVNVIAGWEAGVRNLRVCWEGAAKDRNCGRCEKCLRTMLNFLVCGRPIPACFPPGVDIARELRHVRLGSEAHRAEWRQVLDAAGTICPNADWLQPLGAVIGRRRLIDRLFPRGSWGRNLLDRARGRVRRT